MPPACRSILVASAWVLLLGGAARAQENQSCAAQFNASQPVLGLTLRLSDRGERLDSMWQKTACAAILAAKHANERDGSVVPEFADIPATAPALRLVVRDTDSTSYGAVAAFRAVREEGAWAIVGPARSHTSQYVSALARLDQLPIVSYWASATSLSNQQVNPYFSRSYPSDDMPTKNLVRLIANRNWRSFSMLRVQDLFGADWERALHDGIGAMAREGITLEFKQTSIFSIEATNESIREAVNRMVPSPHRFAAPGAAVNATSCDSSVPALINVIVLVAFDVHMPYIAEAAADRGLLDEGFVWIAPDSPTVDAVNSLRDTHASLFERLSARLIGFRSIHSSIDYFPGYARLKAQWRRSVPADCLVPGLLELDSSAFERDPPSLSGFAYDAAAALALSISRAGSPDLTRQAVGATVLRELRGVDFEGASGHFSFIDNTGDRDARDLEMVEYAWVREDSALNGTGAGRIPRTDGRLEVRPVNRMTYRDNSTPQATQFADVVWLGTTSSTPPKDNVLKLEEGCSKIAQEMYETQVQQSTALLIVLLAISPIILIAGIACIRRMVINYRQVKAAQRNYKQALQLTLKEAIETTSDFQFAASLISAREFEKLGRLVHHEELRDRGLLQFHDRLAELERSPHHVIFFSHRACP